MPQTRVEGSENEGERECLPTEPVVERLLATHYTITPTLLRLGRHLERER